MESTGFMWGQPPRLSASRSEASSGDAAVNWRLTYPPCRAENIDSEVLMLPYLFVLLAIFVRFLPFMGPLNVLPHAWHFTPLAASLLFFGARGSRRQMWIPFVLLAATDVVLTKFVYSYQLTWDQLVTWAWYAAILWLGTNLREKSGPVRVAGAALTSSISFFLISNLAAWAAYTDMYPRTFHGVMMSYAAGLPFFRGTVESDLFFSIAFFGTPVFLHALAGWMHKTSNDHIAPA
jgi:hypothetical protein